MSSENSGERNDRAKTRGSRRIKRVAFAFDLEGTLVDLEKFHQLAFEHVAQTLGVRFGREEFHAFVGAGYDAISKEIARLGAEAQLRLDPKQIREAVLRVYRDILHSHPIEPREGVAEYLEKSATIGGDLVLASLTVDSDAQKILKESKLGPFFKHVLTETSVQEKKPHPQIYLEAARRRRVKNKNLVVHEDSPPGIQSAKAAGSPAIAFPVHEGLKFEPQPDAIYLSWKDVNPFDVIERLFPTKRKEK